MKCHTKLADIVDELLKAKKKIVKITNETFWHKKIASIHHVRLTNISKDLPKITLSLLEEGI